MQTSRIKTYRLPLESNGHVSGFVKSALYVLNKSSFSMSGHVGPLKALVQLRIRPTRSSRVLGFTATDSILTVLFHDYRMMWAGLTLPVGPNLNYQTERVQHKP